MAVKHDIYLGSILLERNRWGKFDPTRRCTYLVSDWTQRAADEGFDGIELWEPHATEADEEERERLRTGPCPITFMNSYASVEPDAAESRKTTAELAKFFGSDGMKFNFGKDESKQETYIEVVREWSKDFKPGFRMVSENHRGTTTANAQLAGETYKKLDGITVGGIIHFACGLDEYRERFDAYGDYLTHIHCNISDDGGKVMTEAEVQERVDFLRERNFTGSFTIEFCDGKRTEGVTMETLWTNGVRDFHLLKGCLER